MATNTWKSSCGIIAQFPKQLDRQQDRALKNFDPENAVEVGHALEDFGVNLLVRDVLRTVEFLETVFGFVQVSGSRDYSLLEFRGRLYQLHGDHTYSENPLPSLLPENGVRGAGVELRLFELDPDHCERLARDAGYEILMATADKLHGLRECFILDPDGYCWVPSVKA